jgi:hypothetical protein
VCYNVIRYVTKKNMETNEQQEITTEAPQGTDLASLFEQEMGMKLSDAQLNYNQAVVTNSLSEAWDVSPKVTKERLTTVMEYVQKLPEDQRATYDSVEGVAKAWAELEQKTTARPNVPQAQSIFGNITPQQPKSQPKQLHEYSKEDLRDPTKVVAYQAAVYESLRAEGYIK